MTIEQAEEIVMAAEVGMLYPGDEWKLVEAMAVLQKENRLPDREGN